MSVLPQAGTALQQVWERECDPAGWNFLTVGLQNGDVFFVLSLMRYFKATRPDPAPIRFIAETEGKFALLKLFSSEIDSIAFCPELARIDGHEIAAWTSANGRNSFSAGSLILLHPNLLTLQQFRIMPMTASNGQVNLVEIFKSVLHLPLMVAPSPPRIPDAIRAEARALFAEYELAQGRTIVMFPYARTYHFDAADLLAEFARLAAARNYVVCSAVHGSEAAIPGTRSIRLSFDLLLPFCELAGNTVVLRSGIADMLAMADLHKIVLYQTGGHAVYDSPNAYGMCDCSFGVVATDVDQAKLAGSLADSLGTPCFAQSDRFLPAAVARYLGQSRTGWEQGGVNDRNICRMGRYVVGCGIVLAEGWSEPEEWGVWSLGFRAVCYLRMPPSTDCDAGRFSLDLTMCFATSDAFPELHVTVDINGRSRPVTGGRDAQVISLELTDDEVATGIHRIIFEIHDPRSPAEQNPGRSDDTRLIAVGFIGASYQISQRG